MTPFTAVFQYRRFFASPEIGGIGGSIYNNRLNQYTVKPPNTAALGTGKNRRYWKTAVKGVIAAIFGGGGGQQRGYIWGDDCFKLNLKQCDLKNWGLLIKTNEKFQYYIPNLGL